VRIYVDGEEAASFAVLRRGTHRVALRPLGNQGRTCEKQPRVSSVDVTARRGRRRIRVHQSFAYVKFGTKEKG
jgi:hypothetical protein